jgi:hypothetical protein
MREKMTPKVEDAVLSYLLFQNQNLNTKYLGNRFSKCNVFTSGLHVKIFKTTFYVNRFREVLLVRLDYFGRTFGFSVPVPGFSIVVFHTLYFNLYRTCTFMVFQTSKVRQCCT